MYYDISDDTTTVENTDFDEDKTQILSGSEILKYFTGNAHPVSKPLSRKRMLWFQSLKQLIS